MKQLIIIEQNDLRQLQLGHTLSLEAGGQIITLGLELNGQRPTSPRAKGERASEIHRRLMEEIKEGDTLNQKRKSPTNIKCKQADCEKLKPFKNSTAFMKHWHKVHKNGKGGKH